MRIKRYELCIICIISLFFIVLSFYVSRFSSNLGFLSIEVPSIENENIDFWVSDDEISLFMPSGIPVNDCVLKVNTSSKVFVEDKEIVTGDPLTKILDSSCITVGNTSYQFNVYNSDNVATMFIDTATGDLDSVYSDKCHKEPVRLVLVDNKGEIIYSNNRDEIRGRGNSTWLWAEKKPFNLYTEDSIGLFDLDDSNEYVLLANYYDSTNIRNKIVYDLFNDVTDQWSPKCEYVELYINGEYNGLYLLTEKIDIRNIESAKYLYAFDYTNASTDDENVIKLLNNELIVIKNWDELTDAERNEAISLVKNLDYIFNEVSENSDFKIDDYIDLNSWANRYLIDEIFENIDVGFASSYFYYKESDGKFYAGPIWDYDLSIGSNKQNSNAKCLYANHPKRTSTLFTTWNYILYNNKDFKANVIKNYEEIYRSVILYYTQARINYIYDFIINDDIMNQNRWKDQFSLIQSVNKASVMDANQLIGYLEERIEFLDSIWIKQDNYYEIKIDTLDFSYPFHYYYLQANDDIELILSENENDIPGFVCWMDESTGEEFEIPKKITSNIYIKAKVKQENNKNNIINKILSNKKMVFVIFSIFLFVVLFFIALIIDLKRILYSKGRKSYG